MKIEINPVTDPSSPELSVFSGLSESQLYHYLEPAPGLFIAESPMIISRALAAGYEPVRLLAEERILMDSPEQFLERCGFLPSSSCGKELEVYAAPLSVLTQITGYALTRGVLCAMRRKKVPDPNQILTAARRVVLLENVMNPTNLGAIFRSAAALGMDGILLTKGCTDPLYRRSARVSMGTVFQIPWAYVETGPSGIRLLHESGFHAAAMTLSPRAVPLQELKASSYEKIALVMGTEGPGLTQETVRECDFSVIIPMAHGVDSLNVAAASAVAFWQLSQS